MDRPIGMFDSGFGGLTVARAVIDLLPGEDLVYIGDTGRYPYGPRPQGEVRVFARELAWSLVKDFHAKAVVVACNTAAAAGPLTPEARVLVDTQAGIGLWLTLVAGMAAMFVAVLSLLPSTWSRP